MKGYIEERTIELANYIIKNKCTVRATAKKFNISKSTVHKDITERLMVIDPVLAQEAQAVLAENKASRHIRGGLATKQKYEAKRCQKA
ncbi:MAG: sporulation transcriptional regulator SpoIIID [Clostridia bacterium]|nr:sporulation transcriptional regulator SpoIIID [Clostridia bacterium]